MSAMVVTTPIGVLESSSKSGIELVHSQRRIPSFRSIPSMPALGWPVATACMAGI